MEASGGRRSYAAAARAADSAGPLPPAAALPSAASGPPATAAARVYFDPRWIDASALPRYLTAVPAAKHRGSYGSTVVLLDGRVTTDGGPGTEELLTAEERIRARKKVIASWDFVTAVGSGASRAPLPVPRFVVTLYAATCQMDHVDLEARLFVVSADDARVSEELERAAEKGRRPTVVPLPAQQQQQRAIRAEGEESGEPERGDGLARYFDAGAYRACVAEDLSLLLCAFEAEVAMVNGFAAAMGLPPRQGFLKLPAIGLGMGVALSDGAPVGALMFAPFLAALRDVLCSRPAWPFLAAIELPDFTGCGAFTPRFAYGTVPVRLITGRRSRRDVLEFTDEEAAAFVCGVVSPGSSFSLPGGGPSATCLEAIIAANTTHAFTARHTANPTVLDPANHVPVHTGFAGQVRWWPPTRWRLSKEGGGGKDGGKGGGKVRLAGGK